MDIYKALSNVMFPRAEYFKWKFNVKYGESKDRTEEEFLKYVNRKSLNGFKRWEKSSEYKQLLAIYLDGLIANDLDEIYKVVREKALTGDPQSVKLLLQLQKEISSSAKLAVKALNKNDNEEIEDDDDLEI